MPRRVTRSVAAVEGAADPSTTDDDRSTLSDSSFGPDDDENEFYHQLASHLLDHSDADDFDKEILRDCRRYNNGLSLSVFNSDYRNSVDMIVEELNFIRADDLANLQGGSESLLKQRGHG